MKLEDLYSKLKSFGKGAVSAAVPLYGAYNAYKTVTKPETLNRVKKAVFEPSPVATSIHNKIKAFSNKQPELYNPQTNNPFKPSVSNIVSPLSTLNRMSNTKFNFGETNKTAGGKLAGSFGDLFLNMPSRGKTLIKEGYGEDYSSPEGKQDLLKRYGRAAEFGADLGMMTIGGGMGKEAIAQGFIKPSLKKTMLEGMKNMAILGTASAPGFIGGKMLQADQGERLEAGKEELKNQAINVAMMSGLGLATPLLGRGTKIGWNEAKNFLGDFKSPGITKSVHFKVDGKWTTYDALVKGFEKRAKKFVYAPGEPEQLAMEIAQKSEAAVFEKTNPKAYKSFTMRNLSGKGGMSVENTAGRKVTPLTKEQITRDIMDGKVPDGKIEYQTMSDGSKRTVVSSKSMEKQLEYQKGNDAFIKKNALDKENDIILNEISKFKKELGVDNIGVSKSNAFDIEFAKYRKQKSTSWWDESKTTKKIDLKEFINKFNKAKTTPKPVKPLTEPPVKPQSVSEGISKAKAEGKSFDEFVESQGEPVFHGSDVKIKKFDTNIGGLGEHSPALGRLGTFFTDEVFNAKNVVRTKTDGGKAVVNKAYLNFKKPKIYEDKGFEDAFTRLIRDVEKFGKTTTDLPQKDGTFKFVTNKKPAEDFKKKLLDEGYDGIFIKGGNSADGIKDNQWIALKNENIKTKSQLKQLWDKPKTIKLKPKPKVKLTKERGFVTTVKESPKTAPEVATKLKGKYTPIKNKQTIAKADTKVTKDFEGAVSRAKIEKNITTEIQAESLTLIDKLQQKGRFEDAVDIVEAMSERATRGGQATQILSAYNKLSPEGVLAFAQRGVTKAKKVSERKYGNLKITPTQSKKIVDMAKKIKTLTGEGKEMATREMLDEIARIVPTPWARKATTLWKAGLLTGIKGAVGGNTVGNTAMGMLKKLSDIPASGIDAALSKIFFKGRRSKAFTLDGIMSGAWEGLKKGGSNLKKGIGADDVSSKLDYQKVYFSKSPLGKIAQKYTDSVFNFYSAADRPFFHSALKNNLYDFAKVEAKNKGLKGKASKEFVENLVKNPREEFLAKAVDAAEVVVFQNRNPLGKGLTGFKKGIKYGETAGGEIIAEGVLPFTGVPSSIATAVHNYSPTGILHESLRAIIELSKNKTLTQASQRKLSEALGKGLTGTGIIVLGMKLKEGGLMTLGYPTDQGERTLWEQEGKQTYSILIGGKWRSMNYMGPIMSLLAIGGEVQKADGTGVESVGAGVAGSGKAIIGSSPLSGLQSSLDAITDPERYGKNYFKNTASSVVPTIVKDVANAGDDTQRESNNVKESIQNRIPLAKNKLNPKRDIFGDEVKRKTSPVGALIDPFKSSKAKTTDVVSELRRLQDTGEGPTLSKPKAKQSVFGQKVELTPEELDKFEQETGAQIKSMVEETIASDGYKGLPDEDKKDIINKLINSVRKDVKEGTVTGGTLSEFDSNNISAKNKIEIQKRDLLNSYENSMKVEGGYIRKSESGDTATFISENKYNSQLNTAKLTSYKKAKNMTKWVETAEKQFKVLEKILNDPNTDEIEKVTTLNKIDTLMTSYNKYAGYGGFTKGKAGKKGKTIKFKAGTPLKLKKSKVTFKAPKLLKISKIKTAPLKLGKIKVNRKKVKINLKSSKSPTIGKKLA